MSSFFPIPSEIPGSVNFDTGYIRSFEVNTMTDGIAILTNGTLSNINDPVNPRDAANKQYVQSQSGSIPGGISGSIQFHSSGDTFAGMDDITSLNWDPDTETFTTVNIASGLINNSGVITTVDQIVSEQLTVSGQISMGGPIFMNSNNITGLPVVQDTDPSSAASKGYVDGLVAASALTWKTAVNGASVTNISLFGSVPIDGVTRVDGYRFLVKDQSVPTQNGIYVSNSFGTLTRTADAAIADPPNSVDAVIASGSAVFVIGGLTNQGLAFVCNTYGLSPDYEPVVYGSSISFITFAVPGPIQGSLQINSSNSFASLETWLTDDSLYNLTASNPNSTLSLVDNASILVGSTKLFQIYSSGSNTYLNNRNNLGTTNIQTGTDTSGTSVKVINASAGTLFSIDGSGQASFTNSVNVTNNATATQLVSTATTGLAPLVVSSTTLVPNLYVARSVVADSTGSLSGTISGPITISGTTSSITSQTGLGTVFVVQQGPTLIRPNIGQASGSSLFLTGTSGASQYISSVAPGLPPLIVSSNTVVPNLYVARSQVSDTSSSLGLGATGLSLVLNGSASGTQLVSTVATSVPPFVVSSTTLVPNLYVARALVADSTGSLSGTISGPITITGTTSYITSQTGLGTVFVVQQEPTLIRPNIGQASGSSLFLTGTSGASQFISSIGPGLPPLIVSSNTVVPNLYVARSQVSDTSNSLGLGATGSSLVLNGSVSLTQLTSTVSTGLPPFVVSSATLVPNLYVARAQTTDFIGSIGTITGPITILGTTSSITSQTGLGTVFVVQQRPSLIEPNIGQASGSSLNLSGTLGSLQYTSTVSNTSGLPPFIVGSSALVPVLYVARSHTSNFSNSSNSLNIGATGFSLDLNGSISVSQLTSTVATGNAPFIVSSTTLVPNLYVARALTADSASVAGSSGSANALGLGATGFSLVLTGTLSSLQYTSTVSNTSGIPPFIVGSSTLVPVLYVARSQLADFSNSSNSLNIGATGFSLDLNGSIGVSQLTSTVTTGNAPFIVSSTTLVPNLYVARALTADSASVAGSSGSANALGLGATGFSLVLNGTLSSLQYTSTVSNTSGLPPFVVGSSALVPVLYVARSQLADFSNSSNSLNIGATGFSLDLNGSIGVSQLTSTVTTGTAPFIISSTTLVPNLYVARALTADSASVAGSSGSANALGLGATGFSLVLTGTLSSLQYTSTVSNTSGLPPFVVGSSALVPVLYVARSQLADFSNSSNSLNIGATGYSLVLNGSIGVSQITSTVATGTAPFIVSSTTLVPNLYVARALIADSTSSGSAGSLGLGATGFSLVLTGTLSSLQYTSTVSNTSGLPPFVVASSALVPVLYVARSQLADFSNSSNSLNIGATGYSLNLNGSIGVSQLTSTVATGTAPLVVSSTTLVPNLYVARALTADSASFAGSSGTADALDIGATGFSLVLNGTLSSLQYTSTVSNTSSLPPFVVSSSALVPVLYVARSQLADTASTARSLSIGATGSSLVLTGSIGVSQLTSTVATGTAPLVVSSTTLVPNLYVARSLVADSASFAGSSGTADALDIGATGFSLVLNGTLSSLQYTSTVSNTSGLPPFVVSSSALVPVLYVARSQLADTASTSRSLSIGATGSSLVLIGTDGALQYTSTMANTSGLPPFVVSSSALVPVLYVARSQLADTASTARSLSIGATGSSLVLTGTDGALQYTSTMANTSGLPPFVVASSALVPVLYVARSQLADTASTSRSLSIGATGSTLVLTGTSPSTSSITGSLTLVGGIGINQTTDASSTTNGGSLTTAGGVAIAKGLYVGGNINVPAGSVLSINEYVSGSVNTNIIVPYSGTNLNILNPTIVNILGTTQSTNTSSGSLVVSGGLGINKDLYVGGFIRAPGNMIFTYGGGAQFNSSLNVIGAFAAPQLTSNIATGTPPLVVSSTTLVSNLYVARALIADNAGTGSSGSLAIGATGFSLVLSGTEGILGITDSTSTATGALIVSGGIGLSKSITIGSTMTANMAYIGLSSVLTFTYLIIGGGGAGGGGSLTVNGGGGGAGGFLTGTTSPNGGSFTITVGTGGTGNNGVPGSPGNPSSAFGLTANGGSGGLSSGGSGGGSSGSTNGTGSGGGSGGTFNTTGGGGGGGTGAIGSSGSATNTGGAGGAGTSSSITGSVVSYAGGGGGARAGSGTAGGGAGATSTGSGNAATSNTGSGGGGGGSGVGNTLGGTGGSGVVIISYPGSQLASGGTVTSSGGNTIHTFTSSGVFAFSNYNSISNSTGALVVNGGVGIYNNLNIGGSSIISGQESVLSTIDSTNSTTGSLLVSGGIGLSKSIVIGGTATAQNLILRATNIAPITVTSSVLVPILYVSRSNITDSSNSLNVGATGLSLVLSGTLGTTGLVNISSPLTSSSSVTGALVLSNGGGIGISSTTDASSSSNGGSFTTAGGLAVGKNLYVGSSVICNLVQVNTNVLCSALSALLNVASSGTADSTSTSTGSITTLGGVGVAKTLWVGGSAGVGSIICGSGSGNSFFVKESLQGYNGSIWSVVGNRGLQIGWNQSGGQGETDLLCNGQGGVGGFYFYITTAASTGVTQISTINQAGVYTVSDYRQKKDFVELDLKQYNVDKLKPKLFKWKSTEEMDLGLIAHEVQDIYPHLVTGIKDGKNTQLLNYTGLIPILVAEIQELKVKYNDLSEKYKNISEKLNNL